MMTIVLLTLRLIFTKDPAQLDYMLYFICFLIETGIRNVSFRLTDLKDNLDLKNL